MPTGPCIVCGRTNYAKSMGGSAICPSCDCGHPPQPGTPKFRALYPNSERIVGQKTIAEIIAMARSTAIEECANIAEKYWPKSDDPTDEPGSTIRNDASLSIAAAIRALGKKG